MTNELKNVFALGLKNAARWRWRLLTMAVLIGLALSLYFLYGGLIEVSTASGVASIETIETRYFDMLLLLKDDQRMKTAEQLPRAQYGREILAAQEEATLLKVGSPFGDIRLLGLAEASELFTIPAEELEGRLAQNRSEIVLPQAWALKGKLDLGDSLELSYSGVKEISRWQAVVVGIYQGGNDYPLALTTQDALAEHLPQQTGNALLLRYHHDNAELAHLSALMEAAYPGAVQISDYLPVMLGKTMLAQAYQPGNFILVLIFLFMGIGILTIALMTFLERRKEIATLKSVGITNVQTVQLLGFEYSLAELGGLLITLVVFLVMAGQISWFADLSSGDLMRMALQGILISAAVLGLSLVYPVTLAKVATVNQLLFARTIPLSIRNIDHMISPISDLVFREVEENVHIVRVPFDSGRFDCMVFKEVGHVVKKGEVIASQEQAQGHFIHNYLAPCDGTVIEMLGANIVIQPSDPETPHYPYSKQLIEDERRRRELLERVRREEKEMIAQGGSTQDRRQRGVDANDRLDASKYDREEAAKK